VEITIPEDFLSRDNLDQAYETFYTALILLPSKFDSAFKDIGEKMFCRQKGKML
jgi:hypothetical protein